MRTYRSAVSIAAGLMAVISLGVPAGRAQQTEATVPRVVQFSGIVKEATGRPVAGVTFSLYKDQASGTPIWLETQNVPLDERAAGTPSCWARPRPRVCPRNCSPQARYVGWVSSPKGNPSNRACCCSAFPMR